MTRSQKALAGLFTTMGIGHFVAPRLFEDIVPEPLPRKRDIVYVSGVAELAGAAGVALPQTRKAAGWGLIALLVAVFPANINMAVNADRYSQIPRWALWARLPLQPLMIWWTVRATRLKD